METLAKLQETAREIVRRGLRSALDVEVRIVRADRRGYELHGRELSPKLSLGRVQVGLRSLTKDGMALAATTTLDVEENVAALEASLRSARPTPLTGFPGHVIAPNDAGHDPGWDAWLADAARLRNAAAGLRDGLYRPHGDDPRLTSLEGEVGATTSWTVLATRQGSAAFKRTHGGAFAMINGAHFDTLHLPRPPAEAEEVALRELAGKTFAELPEREVAPSDVGLSGGREVAAVLHPRLVEDVLRHAADEMFLGASKRTGMSRLEPGQRVWDPAVTLVDSGLEAGLDTTRPCDDEGIPTRETPLVQEGRFAGHVWSRRSAAEGGAESTGNGYRRPMLVEEPNEAPVRDALSGLVMAPGAADRDAVFREMGRGLYVLACLGIHGADKARAAFSATVYDGYWVEDGKVVASLAPGRWNAAAHVFPEGDAPGLFGEVALSRERFDTGSARLPWVRTKLGI